MSHSEQSDHETPFKTPGQVIAAVVAGTVITVIVIILLAFFVATGNKPGEGSDWSGPEKTAARLQPVAQFELRDANAPKVLQTGEQVYAAVCATCHTPGAAGAPKLGDKGSWAARIAQGYETLLKHSLEGIRAMPPKGGNPDLDDVEVARAMVYMSNAAGASFKEPAAPAPVPAADAVETTPAQPAVSPSETGPAVETAVPAKTTK